MTIDLKPEQERVVGRAIRAGLIQNADEVVEVGVETIRLRLEAHNHDALGAKDALTVEGLVELFANSPFAGLDMDFERDPDTGREVKL
jgi:hypothetical protein